MWTNSSPSSSFASKNITLSSSDYTYYEVIYRNTTTEDLYYSTGKIPKGHGCRLIECYAGADGASMRTRQCSYVSATSLKFDIGKLAYGTTGAVTNNAVAIPVNVIGYKN